MQRLRTSVRKAHGKRTARLLVTCACGCAEKLEIYFGGAEGEGQPIAHPDLEIGGVHAELAEWRRVLMPLIRRTPAPPRPHRPRRTPPPTKRA